VSLSYNAPRSNEAKACSTGDFWRTNGDIAGQEGTFWKAAGSPGWIRTSDHSINSQLGEAVLAHARPGIKGTYDLYDYLDEKREALELWAARLREIAQPKLTNVI
jgi:hypothetical protein